MAITTTKSDSPLTGPQLRQAGQSLDEEQQRLVDEEVSPLVSLVVLFFIIAAIEWVRWLWPFAPQPWLFSAAFLLSCLWAWRRIRVIKETRRRLVLGRDGERKVAQTIEVLRGDGYHIIHDLPADGFNLDHVVIGRGGVFLIETKTKRLPAHKRTKEARISLVDGKLYCEGRPLAGDDLGQAKAEARWLEELLQRLLLEHIPVQPVVVFPGWFIECAKPYELPVWVCNPKGLPIFIRNSRLNLSPDLQARIHHVLVQHVHARHVAAEEAL
jgi:Nuclease-related domain